MCKPFFAGACALLLAACAGLPPAADAPTTAGSNPTPRLIEEAWISADVRGEELDSVATWVTPEGATWLVATGKSTHRLSVFDGDGGALLRTVGGRGDAPGRFHRPNGLAVSGDVLFVVERDNHRVQLLS